MTDDSSVQITIGATVDSSLETSTQAAVAQLNKIGAAAKDQQGAAPALVETWKQAADEQTKIWEDANKAIMSSEASFVRDIFSKRKSLDADLLSIGRQLVEQELSSDIKYWTQRGLLAVEGIGQEKATEQGGVLQRLLFDQLNTTSAVSSQAAQTAAVSAGVATRTAVQSAGDSEGVAAHAAAASLTISHDAAQAAAGAYASASQVPMIGWLLGPVAAVGAFGAVMAYDTIASAEGGQWKVGSGEQLTALHKDEMVWPGWAAHGARNMLESFSVGGRGDAVDRSSAVSHQWNYAPTVHGVPDRDVMGELRNNSVEFMSFLRGLTRGGAMKFG